MVNFYTGIENTDAFNTIFDMVSPSVRKRWPDDEKSPKKILKMLKDAWTIWFHWCKWDIHWDT